MIPPIPIKREATDISPKVSTGAAYGAIATLIMWLIEILASNVSIPGPIAGAVAVIVGGIAAYIKTDKVPTE